MDVILIPLYRLVDVVLNLYTWAIIISVVLNWLTSFGIINSYNQFVSTISEFFFRITEPALQPIRQRLPDLGGLDISPLILILGLYFVRQFLAMLVVKLVGLPTL